MFDHEPLFRLTVCREHREHREQTCWGMYVNHTRACTVDSLADAQQYVADLQPRCDPKYAQWAIARTHFIYAGTTALVATPPEFVYPVVIDSSELLLFSGALQECWPLLLDYIPWINTP